MLGRRQLGMKGRRCQHSAVELGKTIYGKPFPALPVICHTERKFEGRQMKPSAVPPPARPLPATIHDVAAAAGVSVGTVSKGLNGTGQLRAETRQRVHQAAK